MIPKHSNPTQYRTVKKKHQKNLEYYWAHAPYNFVPLPEKVVTVDNPPAQDTYSYNTGYIECTLTTCSPLYTRCAMTPDFYKKYGDTDFYKLNEDQKIERAQFFHRDSIESPIIPGSSLRGMVRALVEIAGFGKVQWVADTPKVSFRSVATPNDPLTVPYIDVLGKNRVKVEAGYLEKAGDEWYIYPAKKLSDIGLQGRDSYLFVRDKDILSKNVPGFVSLNEKNYTPQYHDISFDGVNRGRTGKLFIKNIGSARAGYPYSGVLVCSGNMQETSKDIKSPRKNHVVILEKEKDQKAKKLKISKDGLRNYIEGLTDFQKEHPFDEKMGCLKDGRPVFYVADGNEVHYFGHCLNFRIPAVNSGKIASPRDYVPEYLNRENEIDMAEAIFGYVHSKKACAGRVFVTDANLKSIEGEIWLKRSSSFPPKILASPKPTTFQHYLVQDKEQKHDPDIKSQLAHYGTKSSETVIRGHKLYWHKGEIELKDIEEIDKVKLEKNRTQYTRIMPVRKGVDFLFRIYFENLLDHELGALLWVLTLPGEAGEEYRHKLGMGKPLGMGSVKIVPRLYKSDRSERYKKLFTIDTWAEEISEVNDYQTYVKAFEGYVLNRISPKSQKLCEVERIGTLLKMMEWRGPERSMTRYLEIEPDNEFKERPVLPDPFHIKPPAIQIHSPSNTQPRTRENLRKQNFGGKYRK